MGRYSFASAQSLTFLCGHFPTAQQIQSVAAQVLHHVLFGGNFLSPGLPSERGVMLEVTVNWAFFFPDPNSADTLCIISSL